MRMQAVLTTISPALAGVLDLTLRGPLHILAHWQTPAALRRAGPEQIHALLRQYKVNNGRHLTAAVITAARGRPSVPPGRRPTPPFWASSPWTCRT